MNEIVPLSSYPAVGIQSVKLVSQISMRMTLVPCVRISINRLSILLTYGIKRKRVKLKKDHKQRLLRTLKTRRRSSIWLICTAKFIKIRLLSTFAKIVEFLCVLLVCSSHITGTTWVLLKKLMNYFRMKCHRLKCEYQTIKCIMKKLTRCKWKMWNNWRNTLGRIT